MRAVETPRQMLSFARLSLANQLWNNADIFTRYHALCLKAPPMLKGLNIILYCAGGMYCAALCCNSDSFNPDLEGLTKVICFIDKQMPDPWNLYITLQSTDCYIFKVLKYRNDWSRTNRYQDILSVDAARSRYGCFTEETCTLKGLLRSNGLSLASFSCFSVCDCWLYTPILHLVYDL